MTTLTQNIQNSFIDFGDFIINYTDGDIVIFDHLKDLSVLYPLKPHMNLLITCYSGSASLAIADRQIQVNKNDVLFCASHTNCEKIETSEDFECKVLSISENLVHGMLFDKMEIWNRSVFNNRFHLIHMSESCQKDLSLYSALILSKLKNKDTSTEIIQALVRAILLEVCFILENENVTEDEGKVSQGKNLFNRFLRLVSANEVKRQPITQYASQLAITPKYLTMLCLKYSNKTASDWIVQYTTEDIRFYLKNSNMSIKEISAKLGFANMSHFGSYVRKHLGKSPSDFRRNK